MDAGQSNVDPLALDHGQHHPDQDDPNPPPATRRRLDHDGNFAAGDREAGNIVIHVNPNEVIQINNDNDVSLNQNDHQENDVAGLDNAGNNSDNDETNVQPKKVVEINSKPDEIHISQTIHGNEKLFVNGYG